MPIKDPSGILIHPVLYGLNLLLGDSCKVCSFRENSSDHAVVVLVGTFLPGRITVTVIDLEPFSSVNGLNQFIVLHEFGSVVCGDRLELCAKSSHTHATFQLIKYTSDGGCLSIGKFED